MALLEENVVSSSRVKDKDAGDVGKFLNRILGLPVSKQQLVGSPTYFVSSSSWGEESRIVLLAASRQFPTPYSMVLSPTTFQPAIVSSDLGAHGGNNQLSVGCDF